MKNQKTQKTKRLKRVFRTSAEVFEIYAAGTQAEAESYYSGRDGSRQNMRCYFQGRDAFSFGAHYLLARKGLKLNGVDFVFVNESHYSRMTSDHTSEVIRALESAGYNVLTARHENCGFRADTGDLGLMAAVVAELENQGASLAEAFIDMQTRPYNPWLIDDLAKSVKRHNETCRKYGIDSAIVETPDRETLKLARQLYNLYSKAQASHASREQSSLFSVGYRGYKEYRSAHRRTA